MASMFRKAMVYLGLVDDDYDDYEPFDEPVAPVTRPVRAYGGDPMEASGQSSSIRTIPREMPGDDTNQLSRPIVRPIQPIRNPTVHVVVPIQFKDAPEIADRLKAGQPVVVNLQQVDRDLFRRMIDFCSGAAYSLGGKMDRVADAVFLLTPSNVEVSAEERRKLEARGLFVAPEG